MYRITLQRKFLLDIVPLWLKNRNQRVHTGGLMRGGLHDGGGRGVTSFDKRVSLSTGGGGGCMRKWLKSG